MTPAERRAALRGMLAEAGLDALLVTRLVNVRYLTGFTGSAARLLVTADGDGDRLATDGRYAEQAAVQAPDLPLEVTRDDRWLPGALGARTCLGLESHDLSWDGARRLAELCGERSVVPAPKHVEALREVKDDAEVAAVRRACALAGQAFAELPGWLSTGLSEREVAVRLERAVVDLGADAPAFDTIVAAGPNSAYPHHRPTERRLGRGEVVKIDFGARVDGYHSDMTRVVALGDPGRDMRELHDLVRAAQQAGLDAVRSGASAAEIDDACRRVIAEAGRGEAFVHGTGHGVGLEIHEDPRLGPDSTARIRSGAVLTVEPGVYLPGRGGVRIEDTVAVTAAGRTVLTETPKDLVVL